MLLAYVDETGDLGWSDAADPIFGMSAVVVSDELESEARNALTKLREMFSLPPGAVIEWKRIRPHEKRLFIADTLSDSPAKFIHVCMFKHHLTEMNHDPTALYLYTLRFMVERLTWIARRLDRPIHVRFAQMRKTGGNKVNSYLAQVRKRPNSIEWQYLFQEKVFVHPLAQYEMLQMADLSAGPMHSAFVPTQLGYEVTDYLRQLSPALWRPVGRTAYPTFGFKAFPGPDRKKLTVLEDRHPILKTLS